MYVYPDRHIDQCLTSSQSKKANFDATHELEELLLEDNPLKAKKRKGDQDVNTMSSDMRQMEEHFHVSVLSLIIPSHVSHLSPLDMIIRKWPANLGLRWRVNVTVDRRRLAWPPRRPLRPAPVPVVSVWMINRCWKCPVDCRISRLVKLKRAIIDRMIVGPASHPRRHNDSIIWIASSSWLRPILP